MKWLHRLLRGCALTASLFVFQACYGPRRPNFPPEGDVRPITYGNMSAEEINWTSVREKYHEFIDHTTLVYRDVDCVVDDDD